MRFTFKVAKVSRVRDGVVGYSYCAKLKGKIVLLGWNPGSRADALNKARVEAEAYGFVDGES